MIDAFIDGFKFGVSFWHLGFFVSVALQAFVLTIIFGTVVFIVAVVRGAKTSAQFRIERAALEEARRIHENTTKQNRDPRGGGKSIGSSLQPDPRR